MPGLEESVLVVVGDDRRRRRLRHVLHSEGRRVAAARLASDALTLAGADVSLVVVGMDLEDLPGIQAIDWFADRLGAPVVVFWENPTPGEVVDAMRRGAADVITGATDDEGAFEVAEMAMIEARTSRRVAQVQQAVQDQYGFRQLLTQSPRMLEVFDKIQQVARTDANALILGETGTGKELVSRAIHDRSPRAEKPFVAVNCGAFTESLLESELFGHERGRREGLFEMADGGSLFLDELGETSLSVQVNLLRVLEEMRFRRVGGRDSVTVDVRIIAATNVRLEQAVAEGTFREDLFYRLSVFPIRLPPLRERREDIPLLMRHFLDQLGEKHGLEPPVLAPEAMQRILAYPWPGNVRQLRAMCERWVITHGGRRLDVDELDPQLGGRAAPPGGGFVVDIEQTLKDNTDRAIAQVERRYLTQMLQRHDGLQAQVAEAAGITRRTLYTKLKEHRIDAADYKR